MIFFVILMLLGVILMLFFIYQLLSEINDNLLDLTSDFSRYLIISSGKKRKGKK